MRYYLILCIALFFLADPNAAFDTNELTEFVSRPLSLIPQPIMTAFLKYPSVSYASEMIEGVAGEAHSAIRLAGYQSGIQMDEFEDGIDTFFYYTSIKITEAMSPARVMARAAMINAREAIETLQAD